MTDPIVIKVKIRNEEKSLTKSFLDYSGNITASQNDGTLASYVSEVIKEFDAELDSIRVSLNLEWLLPFSFSGDDN